MSIKGRVIRPEFEDGDSLLSLTATLTKGTETMTKVFNASVKRKGLTSSQVIAEDLNWLNIANKDNIIDNLILPTIAPKGSKITWTTSDDKLITSLGIVSRPDNGTETSKCKVKLTAKLTNDDLTEEKVFDCTVNPFTEEDEVRLDAEEITWEMIKGNNISITDVTFDLKLPLKGSRGSDITWITSNETVISKSGVVTRPSYSTGDITLGLTATVKKNGSIKNIQILGLKVTKLDISNKESVKRAIQGINIEDIVMPNKGSLNIIEGFKLPKVSQLQECGFVTIKWDVIKMVGDKSEVDLNNPNVKISEAGPQAYNCVITRPSSSNGNANVGLKATISSNMAMGDTVTEYVVYNITVLAL